MKKQCFNKDWICALGSNSFEKGKWKKVDLPHDFMIEQHRDKNSLTRRDGGYFPGGMGWYSKKFFAPEEWKDRDVFVEFEGIYMNSEIRLNGNVIKRQNYGYTTFLCELNQYLEYGKENELSVAVDNTTIPNSRWYSGSGIYRYAWLYVAEKQHINWQGVYITTKSVENNKAVIDIETTFSHNISKNMKVEHTFRYNENIVVVAGLNSPSALSETNKFNLKFELPSPMLWDIDSPNLYTVTTNLYLDGKLKDSSETTYGIRTFSLSADKGFILNGRNIKLKGGCVHHDNGIIGSASYVRSEERKIELLKKSGFNAVRTAHNPPSPAFLDACDRLGMIVMDEAFDCWREAKTQFDYHREFDRDWEHDLTSMVMRDRNHPSVLMWSIGNEIPEQSGRSNAVFTSKMLADKIRELDNRPVGLALVWFDDNNVTELDKVVEHLDFVGYNYQHYKYEKAHELYPNRAIIGTETVPKEMFDTWTLTEKFDHVLGDFVWTAIDYLGEAGIGRAYYTEERPEIEWHLYDYPWNQAYCGDIDICGFKRPQSYYRDILWGVSDKPKMFVRRPSPYSHDSEKITFWGWHDGIEGWDFPGNEGRELMIDVYTPAKSVDLYLNGVKLETKEVERLTASFKVAYESGELKASDSNGNEVILRTPEAAAKVKLSADRSQINCCGDLSYVTTEIVDKDGNIVTSANNKVTFIVEGAGTLLAAGSANPKTEEMYAGISHSAYDGKLMAVVKSAGEGEIKLTAYSDGLLSDTIIISAGK